MKNNENQPITLGALIDALSTRPADELVRFDFCDLVPEGVDSYRGYYDHLAIGWSDRACAPTVTEFLALLREANGQVFQGYKGGDFRMGPHTPVWVANYGHSHSTAVTGVTGEYETTITTGHCDDWAGGMERAHQVIFGGLGFGNVR